MTAPIMAQVDFNRLAKSPDLRRFFHLIWRLFRVNVGLFDPNGKGGYRIGSSRTVAPFCTALQKISNLRQHCLECDWRHLDLAIRRGKVLRYRCYLGLTEFIIPITTDEGVVACLQSGQVLETKPKRADWVKVRDTLASLSVNAPSLQPLYYRLRVIPPQPQRNLIALLELFANYIARAQKRLRLLDTSWNAQIVGRARIYIGSHLADPLALNAIARAACTSPRNLTRIFPRETGMTVWNYIHAKRIANACQQLASTSKACTPVALECGFGSIQHFNRIFRRLKKTTPSAWRKKAFSGGNRHRPS